jgi:plasmid stability protein
MATLYVENVPDEVYRALRQRAKSNRRSIAAETISMLENALPTRSELRRRLAFYQQVQRIRSRHKGSRPGPSTEDLLREDRQR